MLETGLICSIQCFICGYWVQEYPDIGRMARQFAARVAATCAMRRKQTSVALTPNP
jgi:hypothetical protein